MCGRKKEMPWSKFCSEAVAARKRIENACIFF